MTKSRVSISVQKFDVHFRGLGALVANKFAAEGCNIAINYNASRERAEQVAATIVKNHRVKSILIVGVSFREVLVIEREY